MGAVFIVCNAALGAGILNFPHAYSLVSTSLKAFVNGYIIGFVRRLGDGAWDASLCCRFRPAWTAFYG